MPPTGIPFVYRYCKPIDTVCIGMLNSLEVEEDVRIAVASMSGSEPGEPPLTYSRSKKPLMKTD